VKNNIPVMWEGYEMVPELVFPGERAGDLSSGSPGDLRPFQTGAVLSAAVPEPSNARLGKSGGTAKTNRAEPSPDNPGAIDTENIARKGE
jgi:hypothetical protein